MCKPRIQVMRSCLLQFPVSDLYILLCSLRCPLASTLHCFRNFWPLYRYAWENSTLNLATGRKANRGLFWCCWSVLKYNQSLFYLGLDNYTWIVSRRVKTGLLGGVSPTIKNDFFWITLFTLSLFCIDEYSSLVQTKCHSPGTPLLTPDSIWRKNKVESHIRQYIIKLL